MTSRKASTRLRRLDSHVGRPGGPLERTARSRAPVGRISRNAHRREVYEPYTGALNNLTGATQQQHEAEARLQAEGLSGFELLFGRN